MTKEHFYNLTIDEKELIGRQQAEQYLNNTTYTIDNLCYTPTEENYDLTFSVDDYNYCCEVKLRPNYKSTDFDEAYLEEKKIRLMKQHAPDNFHLVYMMIFKDEVAVIWNVDNIDKYDWVWRELPYDNVNGTAGNKIMKKVYKLPISTGKKLYKDGRN